MFPCTSQIEESVSTKLDILKIKTWKSWFLENVYPELRIPNKDAVGWGAVKQKHNGKDYCIARVEISPPILAICFHMDEKKFSRQKSKYSGVVIESSNLIFNYSIVSNYGGLTNDFDWPWRHKLKLTGQNLLRIRVIFSEHTTCIIIYTLQWLFKPVYFFDYDS